MTSLVPQGSVPGPCLFLFYVNDIPGNIASTIRLFVDDTLIYQPPGIETYTISLGFLLKMFNLNKFSPPPPEDGYAVLKPKSNAAVLQEDLDKLRKWRSIPKNIT